MDISCLLFPKNVRCRERLAQPPQAAVGKHSQSILETVVMNASIFTGGGVSTKNSAAILGHLLEKYTRTSYLQYRTSRHYAVSSSAASFFDRCRLSGCTAGFALERINYQIVGALRYLDTATVVQRFLCLLCHWDVIRRQHVVFCFLSFRDFKQLCTCCT